jgi:hypothetical protein
MGIERTGNGNDPKLRLARSMQKRDDGSFIWDPTMDSRIAQRATLRGSAARAPGLSGGRGISRALYSTDGRQFVSFVGAVLPSVNIQL